MRFEKLFLLSSVLGLLVVACDSAKPSTTGAGGNNNQGGGGAAQGGGGAAQGGGGTAQGGGGAGGGDPLNCDTYCTIIGPACQGEFAQYTSDASCLAACAALPVGAITDTAGNTLGCRIYHAGVALDAPDPHCYHAGPSGGDVCGTPCESFCAMQAVVCTGANQQFADEAECLTACGTLTDDVEFSTAETASDTLACRLYHLTVAAQDAASATTHCPHIAVVSPTCNQ